MSISARPVPLTVAENAAEVKRQERKQKKAQRRKAEKENSQPELQPQPQQPQQPDTENRASGDNSPVAPTEGEHSLTNGHSHSNSEAAANHGSGRPLQAGRASKADKPHKSALHDEERLTLTVAQLKAVVAAANERVVRECCKQMTHLSAKQRKEMQDSLIKEHAQQHSTSLHHSLHNSSTVQDALRRREDSEQADVSAPEVVETTETETAGGIVEGSPAEVADAVA